MVVQESEADRLDALRRRLYARDVTDDDVAAYRTAEQEAAAILPAPSPEPGAVPTAPRRRRAVLAGAAAALLAVAVVALVLHRPDAVRTAAEASPTPSATGLPEARVPTSAAASASFVRALGEGNAPGLLDYLSRHPAFLPDALKTDARADSTEYVGKGSSTIALDPTDLAASGGRVTVIVVLEAAGTYSWAAERVAQGNDRSGPVITLGTQTGRAQPGRPTVTTFDYVDAPPRRLSLVVDASMRWGAVVVFTN